MARNPSDRVSRAAAPANPRRLVLVAGVLGGLVILGAGVLFGLAYRDTPRGAAGTLLASAIGGPFRLVDQHGNTVTDADLKGRWSLIYFGYTHCPDACPTALNDIAIALDELGAKREAVRPVFITVDPERDTPEILKDYVASFDAPILALTSGGEGLSGVLRQASGGRRRLLDGPQLGHLCDGSGGPLYRQLHPSERTRGDCRAAEEVARLAREAAAHHQAELALACCGVEHAGNPPALHHEDAVGECAELVEIGRDEQDRGTRLL